MHIAIAAHPDDIEFGMGALISMLPNPICIVSFQCQPHRQEEARRALGHLGVEPSRVFFTSATTHRGLIAEYDVLLADIQPTHVYTHFYGDSHQEHRIVYDCVLSALRLHPAASCLVWENNQPGGVTHQSFSSRIFLPVTEEAFAAKCMALSEHTSQMQKYDVPKLFRFLRNKAETNGYLCGSNLAESFNPIKLILKL